MVVAGTGGVMAWSHHRTGIHVPLHHTGTGINRLCPRWVVGMVGTGWGGALSRYFLQKYTEYTAVVDIEEK